eukprot:GCRY01002785.1.p1 GENE.GCRY01002785.1~~GCRY01002785.1.p1  ORF type:complete len:609 (-),score=100.62 GCRY01002785.1:698-2524(-)
MQFHATPLMELPSKKRKLDETGSESSHISLSHPPSRAQSVEIEEVAPFPKLTTLLDPEYSSLLLKEFHAQFKSGIFCDVKLYLEEDFIVAGHRVVLAASSGYFREHFMKSSEGTIHLPTNPMAELVLDSTLILALVEYVYTGTVLVTPTSVEDCVRLIRLGTFLIIPPLVRLCCRHLVTLVGSMNCIMLFDFAHRTPYCESLREASLRVILARGFDENSTDTFLWLTWDLIREILGSNDLNVRSERRVLEVAVDWLLKDTVRQEAYGEEVLKLVRFPFVPKDVVVEQLSRLPDKSWPWKIVSCQMLDTAEIKPRKNIGVLDLLKWRPMRRLRCQSEAGCARSLLVTGNRLLVGCGLGLIESWDLITFERVGSFVAHEGVVSSLLMFNGMILSASYEETGVKVWDSDTLELREFIEVEHEVRSMVVCEKFVVVGGLGEELTVISADSWVRVCNLEGHENGVCALGVVNGRLVSGADDGTIRVWNPLNSWECEKILEGHEAIAMEFGVCKDVLISASYESNGQLKVWRTRDFSFELERVLDIGGEGVSALFACRQRLVTAEREGGLSVWDTSTMQCVKTVDTMGKRVSCLTSWEDMLLGGASDGSVFAWK